MFLYLLALPVIAIFLYLIYQNISLPHEPSVVKTWIPFLGSGLAFSNDCAGFLAKQRARFGDIFTVFLSGRRFHVVLNADAWDVVFYNKRPEVTFIQFAKQAKEKAFGFRPEISYIPEVQELSHNYYIKYLMGRGLDTLSDAMNQELLEWFNNDKKKVGQGVSVCVPLFEFLYKCGFDAGVMTFFGKSCLQENPKILELFRKFDSKFSLLFGGAAPLFAIRDSLDARIELETYMSKANFDGTQSDFIKAFHDMCQEQYPAHDQKAMDIGKSMVALMWTSHSNTLPSLFWFIYYVFKDPHVLSMVRGEIDSVLTKYDIKESLLIPRAAFKDMPIVDSCWQEVLRLRTGSLTMRGVNETCSIPLPSGELLNVRKGDSIALFPYLHHHDPEIFPNPNEFQYDRFLVKDGKAPVFYKKGVKLKNSLVAFGGGVSMCPGRFFIANEVKMLVAIMISLMDFEFDPGHKTPVGDPTRCGLGIIPPIEDVPVTYRYRV